MTTLEQLAAKAAEKLAPQLGGQRIIIDTFRADWQRLVAVAEAARELRRWDRCSFAHSMVNAHKYTIAMDELDAALAALHQQEDTNAH